MDIAENIVHLVAHRSVLQAECSKITADITQLQELSSRYGGPKAANSSTALKSLRRLREEREAQINEIDQQLDLFRLHAASSDQLLRRIRKSNPPLLVPPVLKASLNIGTESTIFSAPTAIDTHVNVDDDN